jgi:hypothetical protein
MSTGEGAAAGGTRDDHADKPQRPDRIGVGGPDESVTRIQLAARWAETFAAEPDSLGAILRRFRAAYEYLDAVTHGVEPPALDREMTDAQPIPEPLAAPPSPQSGVYSPPADAAPQPGSPPESRPWS